MDDTELTIGQVAERAGLSVSAIRFYEAEGLLPAPPRVSGRRRYGEDVLERLGVIGVAKSAGLRLDDIRTLLVARDAGRPAHEPLRELAERRLPDVEQLIARAEAMRDWLSAARGCGCGTLEECGLFELGGTLPSEVRAAPGLRQAQAPAPRASG